MFLRVTTDVGWWTSQRRGQLIDSEFPAAGASAGVWAGAGEAPGGGRRGGRRH